MGSNDKISGDRDADIYGQRIRPLDQLLHEKRMPVLFVGSGISGRYMDTCTWDALLEKAAAVMGIDRFRLNGIKAGLETEHPGANVYPLLASELSKRMNGMIGRGELTRDSFPGMTDGEWGLMETCNPFKAVVCSIVKGGKLTDDPEKLAELESFRKVAGKVPAVITTNYDRFLETEVFDGFDTLVYPDDFYFSGSEGYGEILKIHGTADAPDSIVLTSEDYDRLRRESKVILSRLTYLMCYHPVIFIGYSLRDEEVHDMIFDLVSSLKQDDLDRASGHILMVGFSDKPEKPVWGSRVLEKEGKMLEVIDLEVSGPEVLFRYLDRFTPVASASEIKMYGRMAREALFGTDPSSVQISADGDSIRLAFSSPDGSDGARIAPERQVMCSCIQGQF